MRERPTYLYIEIYGVIRAWFNGNEFGVSTTDATPHRTVIHRG